jgi:hypothetical protein
LSISFELVTLESANASQLDILHLNENISDIAISRNFAGISPPLNLIVDRCPAHHLIWLTGFKKPRKKKQILLFGKTKSLTSTPFKLCSVLPSNKNPSSLQQATTTMTLFPGVALVTGAASGIILSHNP